MNFDCMLTVIRDVKRKRRTGRSNQRQMHKKTIDVVPRGSRDIDEYKRRGWNMEENQQEKG